MRLAVMVMVGVIADGQQQAFVVSYEVTTYSNDGGS